MVAGQKLASKKANILAPKMDPRADPEKSYFAENLTGTSQNARGNPASKVGGKNKRSTR